jgi:hypothetical protein
MIRKGSEFLRSLAEHGLIIPAREIPGLRFAQPVSPTLENLDVTSVILGLTPRSGGGSCGCGRRSAPARGPAGPRSPPVPVSPRTRPGPASENGHGDGSGQRTRLSGADSTPATGATAAGGASVSP